MNINRILILGSTYLTELVVQRLLNTRYELVGHVPSRRTTVSGNIPLPEVDIDSDCDIILSVQYDMLVKNPKKCYNFHTGLLPEYGGLDILRHTLEEKAHEQGATFHKMNEKYDSGPIISKITYPVFENDTIKSLYKRQCSIVPDFVVSCLSLLENLKEEDIDNCNTEEPRLLDRVYQKTPIVLEVEEKNIMERLS